MASGNLLGLGHRRRCGGAISMTSAASPSPSFQRLEALHAGHERVLLCLRQGAGAVDGAQRGSPPRRPAPRAARCGDARPRQPASRKRHPCSAASEQGRPGRDRESSSSWGCLSSSVRRSPVAAASAPWRRRCLRRTGQRPPCRGIGPPTGAGSPTPASWPWYWAERPTRDTDRPTLMAGRTPAWKSSLSR